jgi:hypothetical protein
MLFIACQSTFQYFDDRVKQRAASMAAACDHAATKFASIIWSSRKNHGYTRNAAFGCP